MPQVVGQGEQDLGSGGYKGRVRTRRILLLALVAAMLGASCQGPPDDRLVLWHSWSDSELAALEASIARFEAHHPGVRVMALQVPSDRLEDKYLQSSAANGGPDLVIGNTDWVGKFVETGVLAPVTLMPAERDRYAPKVLSALTYRGKLWAVPESLKTLALYYNKALIARPPATMADLAHVTVPQGDYVLADINQFYFNSGSFFGLGGELLGPGAQSLVASPATLRWLGYLRGLASDWRVVIKGCDYGRADALFQQGKAAMTINGSWTLARYEQVLGKDLGVAPLPPVASGEPQHPFVDVNCFMFNPNSNPEHRKWAGEFVEDFTSASNMARVAAVADHIPAFRHDPLPAGSPLAVFAAQAAEGTMLPSDPRMKDVFPVMDETISEVLTGAEGADTAIARANRLLSARFQVALQEEQN